MKTIEIVQAIRNAKLISAEAANTLVGTIAKTPALFAALLSDLTDEDRGAIVSAVVATYGKTPEAKPATSEGPEIITGATAAERVVTWLRAEQGTLPGPKKHAPGDIRAALSMAQGTFGEALKSLRDAGTITAEGQGAGRRIWMTPGR